MFSPKQRQRSGAVSKKTVPQAGAKGATMNDLRQKQTQEKVWMEMMNRSTDKGFFPEGIQITEVSQPKQGMKGQVFFLKDAQGKEYVLKLDPNKGALERENYSSNFIKQVGSDRVKAPESELVDTHSDTFKALMHATMYSEDEQAMQLAKTLSAYGGESVLLMEKMPGRRLETLIGSEGECEEDRLILNQPATLWGIGETLAFDVILGNTDRLTSGISNFGNMLFDDVTKQFSLIDQTMWAYGQRQGAKKIAPEEFQESKTKTNFIDNTRESQPIQGSEWEVVDYQQIVGQKTGNAEAQEWEREMYGKTSIPVMSQFYAKSSEDKAVNIMKEMLDMYMLDSSGQGRAVAKVCESMEDYCGVSIARPELIGAGFVNALKNIALMMRSEGAMGDIEEQMTGDFEQENDSFLHGLTQVGNLFANSKFLKKVEKKLNKEKERMEREEGLRKVRHLLGR